MPAESMRNLLVAVLAAVLLVAACGQDRSEGRQALESAREAYRKGYYLEAETGYERYLQIAPRGENRLEAWNRLLEIALNIKSDFERAAVLLDAMYLEFGSDREIGWDLMVRLGDIHLQQEDYTRALVVWERCLDLAGNHAEKRTLALLKIARIHRAQRNYDLVQEALLNCVQSAPDGPSRAQCLYELGQTYSYVENWDQAREVLEEAMAIPDVDPELHALVTFLLVDVYENQRELDRARELLLSIKDTYPNPLVIETRLDNLGQGLQ